MHTVKNPILATKELFAYCKQNRLALFGLTSTVSVLFLLVSIGVSWFYASTNLDKLGSRAAQFQSLQNNTTLVTNALFRNYNTHEVCYDSNLGWLVNFDVDEGNPDNIFQGWFYSTIPITFTTLENNTLITNNDDSPSNSRWIHINPDITGLKCWNHKD